MIRLLALWMGFTSMAGARAYVGSDEEVPSPAREFRAAWVACIYNIDWPSSKGLIAFSRRTRAISRSMPGSIHFGQCHTRITGFPRIISPGRIRPLSGISRCTSGWTRGTASRVNAPWM